MVRPITLFFASREKVIGLPLRGIPVPPFAKFLREFCRRQSVVQVVEKNYGVNTPCRREGCRMYFIGYEN
jgi:hypothetical protein